ncbi:hypothetical protein [Bacillus anthracis]|nr:hypothetical protein [Bacillus anthracis]
MIDMFNSKVVSAHHVRIQGLQEDNYNGILLSLPKLKIEQKL